MPLRPEPTSVARPQSEGIHLRVSLRLLPTTEGGRASGIAIGYRSSWAFDTGRGDNTEMHDAPIVEMDPPSIAPGEAAVATIRPIAPQYWFVLPVGAQLAMREGPRTVGSAVVIDGPNRRSLSWRAWRAGRDRWVANHPWGSAATVVLICAIPWALVVAPNSPSPVGSTVTFMLVFFFGWGFRNYWRRRRQ